MGKRTLSFAMDFFENAPPPPAWAVNPTALNPDRSAQLRAAAVDVAAKLAAREQQGAPTQAARAVVEGVQAAAASAEAGAEPAPAGAVRSRSRALDRRGATKFTFLLPLVLWGCTTAAGFGASYVLLSTTIPAVTNIQARAPPGSAGVRRRPGAQAQRPRRARAAPQSCELARRRQPARGASSAQSATLRCPPSACPTGRARRSRWVG